jgi:S-formylglutathione hydrolase FrmB
LFGNIIALSPAVYDPEPPAGSSARTGGAFGTPTAFFDAPVYRRQAYPAMLNEYPAGLHTRLQVAVGTDEEPDPTAPPELAVDVQAERLVVAANNVPGIRATLSRYPGGHGWETWTPALQAALGMTE